MSDEQEEADTQESAVAAAYDVGRTDRVRRTTHDGRRVGILEHFILF